MSEINITNKATIIESIYDAVNSEITKKDITRIIDLLIIEVHTGLRQGDKIAIPGIGSFQAVPRAATTRRNPQTREPIECPAGYRLKFKASSVLKKAARAV